MVLLAATLVLALHTVDRIAPGPDGYGIVNVPHRLVRLAQDPLATENWWIYLTLFTTLVPSALNGIIGMCSLAALFHSKPKREALIRKVQRLTDKDESIRRDVALALQAPVFIGTLAACLCIWAAFNALMYGGSFVLSWFLGVTGWWEWQLIHGFGH
jgi:hypothetical protein